MRLIIAGGRYFDNYKLLRAYTNKFTANHKILEIVSGKAKGADYLGEVYAREYNIPIKEFPANWDEYGKKAGYIRNEEMALYATHLIAFWDGSSKGTKSMIELANKYNLQVRVVRY